MNKEKLYKESEEFTIYCNYGVLGAEKRNVHTYGCKHSRGICADEIKAKLPENNYFQIYETAMGDLAVESAWGWQYSINDVLQGDEKPCFYAIDKDGDGHRVYLDEI